MRPTRSRAALIGSAVLVAGCSSTVAGSAQPAGAGPFTEITGRLDLATVDDTLDLYDVAATPDGSYVGLLTGNLGTANRQGSVLVELLPSGGGLTVGRVTEGAAYAGDGLGGEVYVAADGTVVALGPVVSADGAGFDLAVTLLPAGAEQVDVALVAPDPDLGTPDEGTGVLSADGTTLYASLRWEVEVDRYVNRLAAIDVATGELVASEQVQVETDGVAVVYELALRPDGGVVALVQNTRDRTGAESGAQLVEYDADLQPVGDPVEVLPDESYDLGETFEVLPDGTAVVALRVDEDGADHRLVTVRDGEALVGTAIPGKAWDVVVDAAGRHAYVNHTREENGAAVATVDLTTGEVVADVVLCDGLGTGAELALAADGSSLAARAECPGGAEADPLFLLG
ncbi:hypothetical protein [Geodermatophilus saharensis]|nr:hypothetical protein [Geodermatophilus saharensis]